MYRLTSLNSLFTAHNLAAWLVYNLPMFTLRNFIPGWALVISLFLLTACQAATTQTPNVPGFFYLLSPLGQNPAILVADHPGDAARLSIPLNPPADCTLFALRPAPHGRWIAVEWECSFGPAVELFDTANGNSHFALSDPTIDSRFLAWQPDGSAIYLKIGTLSVPQTLRVDVETSKALELPVSPFAYDLTASPDGSRVLYSLTKGIGFGSETWLAGPDGQNPSQLLVDAGNITALANYSPDGSQVAYIRFPDNQQATPPGELWVMDAQGFKPRKLAEADAGRGFAPVWSPDGSKIAFIGRASPDKPDALTLNIYDLKTSNLTTVYPAAGTAPGTQPAWAPDGSAIAFSDTPQPTGQVPTGQVPTGQVPTGHMNQPGSDTINVWFYEISSGQVSKLVGGACCAGWIR